MAAQFDEHQQFVDSGGEPVVNGFIYIGTQGADPVLNPITIYSDRALTSVLANPQLTDADGRAVNKIWIPGRYSVKVEDLNNVQLYENLDNGEEPQSGVTGLINVIGADNITAEGSPTITAYVDTELYPFISAGVNTGPVTLDINSVGAKDVLSPAGNALIADEIPANRLVVVGYDLTADNFYMVNPTNALEYTGNKTDGQVLSPRAATVRGFEWENNMTTDTKSATYTVVVADQNKIIGLSGASFTVNLTSAATLGSGFVVRFHHNGTSASQVYTIDPAGSETIDGATTVALTVASETIGLVSDGTNWHVFSRSRQDEWAKTGLIDLTSGSPTIVSLASGLEDVSEIKVYVEAFTTNAANQAPMIQIGDSGGLETSAYSGHAANISSTTVVSNNSNGFLVSEETQYDAAVSGDFTFSLEHMGSNVWVFSSSGSSNIILNSIFVGNGAKTLSAALDRLSITTSLGAAVINGGIAYVKSR